MRLLSTVTALLAMTASFSGASASGTDMTWAADTTTVLGEVNVTAVKSGGSLSSAPVALSVISRKETERFNIVTMKNVSELVPNFYIPDYGSRMTSSIYMRGIGARIDQPAVGLNIDNVPVLNKDAYDFDIVDIDNIEVLRGPQSTMYGRNTMAGLINITTISPLRYQGVRVMAEGGTGSVFRGSVSGYGKLSRNVGMSLSGYYNYAGGFVTNVHSGAKADRESGASFRWKTSAVLAPNVKLENTASAGMARQHGYPYAYEETGQVNYNDTCFYRRTTVSDGLTLSWDEGRFKMVTILSYQYIDDNMTLDQDFLPVSYFTLSQMRKEHAGTAEIVFKGSKGNYSWIAGAMGMYKHSSMQAPVTFKETGIEKLIIDHVNEYNPTYPIRWNEDAFVLGSDFVNPVWLGAVYHRSTYRLGDWEFQAGLRFDYEDTELRYRSHCATSYTTLDLSDPANPGIFSHDPVNIDDRGRLSHSFSSFTPSAGVTYTPSRQVSLYATVGKGYKAGGYNTQMFSDVLQQRIMSLMGIAEKYDVDNIVSYKPEKSINYELGGKFRLLDNRLHASAAIFYIDIRDQQLTMFPDGTTTGRIMANAGHSRSFGGELSATYTPTSRWILNASYGYTRATFVSFSDGRNDYAGRRVPYAPSNTLFLAGQYTLPVRSKLLHSVSFGANLRGVGDIYWNEDNTRRQPFYAQLGASVILSHDRYSIDFSGENLTATKFETFRYVSIGNNFFQRGKPARGRVTLRIFI